MSAEDRALFQESEDIRNRIYARMREDIGALLEFEKKLDNLQGVSSDVLGSVGRVTSDYLVGLAGAMVTLSQGDLAFAQFADVRSPRLFSLPGESSV